MTQESIDDPVRPIALVVDDEPLILLDTSDVVADAGYQVVEARDADEALVFLERGSACALLVTDIQMPGSMNGMELACLVGERWPYMRIVVLSGAVTPSTGELPSRASFMAKPLDQRAALTTLRKFQS